MGTCGHPPELPFKGFPDFRSNVTYTPIQFFTVAIPRSSRSAIRIVAYVLRQLLGYVDRDGNPSQGSLRCSYQDFILKAGVSRDVIAEAVAEAMDRRFLQCLEAPAPGEPGHPGRPGVYALRWDINGPLTHLADEFQGFYYPPAGFDSDPLPPGERPRPRMARMNIPNAFFDHVIPNERLSVIRVVGALLFYSIEWGPSGERKRPITKTVTDLAKLARLGRSKAHEALMIARQRGYIELVHRGRYIPGPVPHSTGSTYRIRWCRDDPTHPNRTRTRPSTASRHRPTCASGQTPAPKAVPNEFPFSDRSESGNETPVRNRGSDRSETCVPRGSEKVNALILKEEYNPQTTTVAAAAAAESSSAGPSSPEAASEEFAEAMQCLQQAGFDATTARRLATDVRLDVVRNQVEWLPLRNPSRNRLGLLRRAIEENWARPEAPSSTGPMHPCAAEFTRHYYAAYHGFNGPAATEGFEADLQAVSRFLPRLLAVEPDERRVAHWGTQFGELVRSRHQGDHRARPHLAWNLVTFGDQLLRRVANEAKGRTNAQRAELRAAHEIKHQSAYQAYLKAHEQRFQREFPAEYQAFLDHRRKEHEHLRHGPLQLSEAWVAKLDREDARIDQFARRFAQHPQAPALGFWEWDQQINPDGLGRRPVSEVQA
ncbi:MAG: hypothetical protein IT580_09760 [Verrucomicrobiales bacterium]|nr:hypothetical protein [Verrucomicrobiales bacterium]